MAHILLISVLGDSLYILSREFMGQLNVLEPAAVISSVGSRGFDFVKAEFEPKKCFKVDRL